MNSKPKHITQDNMEAIKEQWLDYWYWYKNRPLNANTQLYWNDVSYCMITAFKTCTENTLVNIDWTVTRVSSGRYKTKEREPSIPYWVVRIPSSWLYMINYQPELQSKTYSSNPAFVYRIEDNWWKTWSKQKIWPTWTYWEMEFISIIASFTKWDELMPKILQTSWGNVNGGMIMHIVKL